MLLVEDNYLSVLKNLKKNVVDLIICDLNYGNLNKDNPNAQKYREKADLKILWTQLKRVVKPTGTIIFFGAGLYTCEVMMSNKTWWRYNWVWKKGNKCTGFLNVAKRPLTNHEDIIIFQKLSVEKGANYNPRMTIGEKNYAPGFIKLSHGTDAKSNTYGKHKVMDKEDSFEKYPISVINFDVDKESKIVGQKPELLMEYLIKTYALTEKDDNGFKKISKKFFVVDLKSRGGTVGVVCKKLDIKYLSIDDDRESIDYSTTRITNVQKVTNIKDKLND